MAKRFTCTDKWNDPWYRRLTPIHKCLWQYLVDNCDNSGVWKTDYELASFKIKAEVRQDDLLTLNEGKDRLVIEKDHVVIIDFIPFQIGNLTGQNLTNLQRNCLNLLAKHKERGLDVMGKLPVANRYIDKGKGKGNIKDNIAYSIYTKKFEEVWKRYPKPTGKKAAFRHFKASVKTETDLKSINKALDNYSASEDVYKGFIKKGSTWFNEWQDWINYTNPVCPKCKGKGKYNSTTGYPITCDCPAGRRLKVNG